MSVGDTIAAGQKPAPAWHAGGRIGLPKVGMLRGVGAPTARKALHGEQRFALVMIAVATAFLPLLTPTGPANVAPVDLFIGLGLAASLLWIAATNQRVRFPYLVALSLTLLGGAIGALVGPVPTTGLIALLQDLWLACWCWAVFNISRTARNLQIVLSTWIYSAIAWGTVLMIGVIISLPALTGVNAREGSRVQLTMGDPSYAANYFFITIMLMWATQRPRRRSARVAASLLFIVAIALTGSNSGVTSLLVGGGIAAVAGTWRRWGAARALTALLIVILAGGLVATSVSLTKLQNQAAGSPYPFIRDGFGRGTSLNQRGVLLQESLTLFRNGSIFGEGPASTKPRLQKSGAAFDKQAHDDYLGALTERGFVGFAGVLLLVGCLLLRAGGTVAGTLRNGYESVLVRPNALLGAVAGTLVAAAVYGLLHNRHIWTLYAITAAASYWGQRHE